MVKIPLIERFITEAEASGAEVLRFGGPDEAIVFVSSLVKQSGQSYLLASPDVIDHFPGTAALTSPLPRTKEEWMRAEVGLVRADYGLARTGTLVHLDRTDEERLCWTLPSSCICFLSAESIVYEAEELAPLIANHLNRGDFLSPAVSLVTGPSRTADIEGQLVCGVHGPKRLIILLLHTATPSTDERR